MSGWLGCAAAEDGPCEEMTVLEDLSLSSPCLGCGFWFHLFLWLTFGASFGAPRRGKFASSMQSGVEFFEEETGGEWS